ncbi:MAG: hypothetical protein AAGK37_14255 [Pseudomonadota bacterium]
MSDKHLRSEPDVVLSTVRRVVSGSSSAAEPDAELDGAPERLLLTPALRVTDDVIADALPSPSGNRRTRVQTRTLTAERLSLEQRIAELEQAVGEGDGWEPDGSEPVDTETPSEFVFGGARHARVPSSLPEEARATVTLVDENDLVDAGSAHVASVTEENVSPNAPEVMAEQADAEAVPDASTEPASMAIHSVPPNTPEAAPLDPVRVETRRAPDRSRDTGIDLDDDRVIDEEALRDIVAEIVRSELQGELGERITRNVRKLVRREIHRAIMTRDFG